MQSPRVVEQQCAAAAHPSADWHEQGSDLIKAHSPERMVQVGRGHCRYTSIPALSQQTAHHFCRQISIICSAEALLCSDSCEAAAEGDMQQLSDAGQRACKAVQCCSP